ncbi:unnamed protein product [Blepharisma stoltei]|uniref:Ribosome recycling factor domain-containing protein n=1 Tax=Blepharisma stoltei TaxID=1481888 RepID=A0AAU9JEF2_9CILI|nr:unnamed protein product [Blepharisma stoltei]
MLSRYIIRFGRSNLRCFSQAAQAAQAAQPAQAAPSKPESSAESLIGKVKAEITKDFHVVDFKNVPAFTLGNFSERMETALIDLLNGLRGLQGGKGAVNFIENIQVYSFLEYQPLSNAAKVESLGNNQFKVSVFDPANAPQVELAIKKSPFKLQAQRNLDVITVTMTPDKENTLKAAESLAEETRKKITAVYQEGLQRFKGRDPNGERSMEILKEKNLQQVDKLLAKKQDQFK